MGSEYPTQKDWLRIAVLTVYSIVFFLIVASAVWQLATVSPASSSSTVSGSTITDLVVRPIVENPRVQIIFEHIFYLLVWLFLFLLFPVAFSRLKRLKFFQFEFEIEEKEKHVIEVLNVTTSKTALLSKFATDKEEVQFIREVQHMTDVKEALQLMTDKIRDYYEQQLGMMFEYEVVTKEKFEQSHVPRVVKKSYPLAKESHEAVPINKDNSDQLYKRNFLLAVKTYEGQEYAIVLSSHLSVFDEYDMFVVSGLLSLAIKYFERANVLQFLRDLSQ